MKVRIALGLGGSPIDAEDLRSIVSTMTALRFDSLWVSDVLTAPGLDPIVTLSTAAALSPTLKLGTTLLAPGRHELRFAKTLASLDVVSGGRLLLTFVPGLAYGPERDAIGVTVADRGAAIERTMSKLRRWWAGETVDGVVVQPRPVQDPLEIWLAGLAPASLERCGRIGDGWLGAACTPREAQAAREAIDAAADAADRAVDPEHFGISLAYRHEPLDDAHRAALSSRTKGRDVDPAALVPIGYDALRRQLQAYIDVGMSKFVVRPAVRQSWTEELAELALAIGDLQN
ncbi:MAG TPA: LLM class flavin-dependent oxidoreductase [Mycobacteriales bacterium]|nr:LLM class flavin-dependent oxidoreductase [Mycobacteriales bacterium]